MDKVKVIILGTGEATYRFIAKNYVSEHLDIMGVILDPSVCEKDRNHFVERLHDSVGNDLNVYAFSEENLKKCELIFSPEYRKIIPKRYTEKFLMINCHGGILPKWRGFAANAWAIMNGEKEIGYSIHRVSDKLDDGEIYFVKRISIEGEKTYADVHQEMVESISNDVPQVLYDIVRNNRKGVIQQGESFAYCTKFQPQMGNLSQFDKNAEYYVNLYKCMAKPLGTGIYFCHNGVRYDIGKIEHGKKYNSLNYIGTPGKIVNIEENKLWVKTQDNVIVLSDISSEGQEIEVPIFFINGMSLQYSRKI